LIHSAGYGYVLVSFAFFCEFNALRQNAMKYATHGASSCLLYGLPHPQTPLSHPVFFISCIYQSSFMIRASVPMQMAH